MIIGITGTLGAGKGTVVEILKKRGFAHYSSSDILMQILNERSLELTRKNMSELANELMEKYEGGVLSLSHELAKKNNDRNYILEAIHRIYEANYIKNIGGLVLGVDADVKIRYERITRRQEGEKDNVTFEQFLADTEREEDGEDGGMPNIKKVFREANFLVTNNGTLEELQAQVDSILQQIIDTQK
jgi:dephospho-CoA kinase